jgi:putative acetyltransferase
MISASHITLKIRPLMHDDLEKILEVQSSALRTSSASYSAIQIESLVRGQASARLDPDEKGFVAESDHEIVGFVSFLLKRPNIAGIYVHPDFMRQGIGTQLLAYLERFIIDEGYQSIYVSSSLIAVEFYKNSGYQKVLKSGFYSEGKIWVQCEILEKHLVCPIHPEIWHRRTAALFISVINPLCKWIQSNPWAAFVLGFILFKTLSYLIDLLH